MQYLKPEQHYIDLYDSGTIDYCRGLEQGFQKKDKTALLKKAKMPEKIARGWTKTVADIAIYFYSGERALTKEETIQKWMQEDRERDEKLETTLPPRNIFCPTCGVSMTCETKDLRDAYNLPLRVLFIFRCATCKKGRAIYEGGQEWEIKKVTCPQCRAVLNEKDSRKGKKITTTYTCLNCGYTKKDVFDLTVRKEKPDPYFERDRARFCFSKEQASDYFEQKIQLESVTKMFDELKVRDKNKPLYDGVAALKRLTIDQLEKLLTDKLKKKEYTKLTFQQPETDKYVIIPFTIRDTKEDRDGQASEYDLQRVIKRTLEDTNWRLMTGGVSYRLGLLSGKLKGYEREEDLVKLVELGNKNNSVQHYNKYGALAKNGEGYIL